MSDINFFPASNGFFGHVFEPGAVSDECAWYWFGPHSVIRCGYRAALGIDLGASALASAHSISLPAHDQHTRTHNAEGHRWHSDPHPRWNGGHVYTDAQENGDCSPLRPVRLLPARPIVSAEQPGLNSTMQSHRWARLLKSTVVTRRADKVCVSLLYE